MTYVSGFDSDVFISYSHVDNLPLATARPWVDEFETALANRLAMRVGRLGLVRIWRDRALDGSQVFNDVIARRVARSAVFLALNSRGYLVSDYCKEELTSFCEQASRGPDGLQIGERRRAIHVLLTNVPRAAWLSELGGTTGFHFHDGPEDERQLAENARIAEPLDPASKEFAQGIRALADAVFHLLKDFRARRAKVTAASSPALQRYVYLAETADTLRDVRLRLAADLHQAGAKVVADIPPPYAVAEHEATVRRVVAGAALSVHLLDHVPGRPVDGEASVTYPRAQIHIALETRTPQLIWMPPAGEVARLPVPEHLQWLEDLERGPHRDKPYDFVRVSPASLSRIVLEKLRGLESPTAAASQPPDTAAQSVLIDTHLKDQGSAFDLAKYLSDRGIQPFIHQETDSPSDGIAAFEGQLARVRTLVRLCHIIGFPKESASDLN